MGTFIYQWIDLIWLPIAWFAVHKRHRWAMLAFVLTCIVTLRTQVELMDVIGYTHGMMPFMDSPARTRGLIIYGTIIALFMALAHYSSRTMNMVFLAAAISTYIFAFCVSMVVMLL
ncbi:MAG: hypothetical protein H6867_01520 [Rhodospirillales bacterium]|nr:hypothetical protein [Rhodospirillales bacterium]MCB9997196.1 hypothetical protein [Rhodospirillales bacterium]